MDTRRLLTPWTGWGWYESFLTDPDGNRYSQEMVRTSLYTQELAHQLCGSPLQVFSLKQELRRRLATPPPEIVIRWGDQEMKVSPPAWNLAI